MRYLERTRMMKSLQELEEDILLRYTMMMATCDTHNLFNPNKLEEGC